MQSSIRHGNSYLQTADSSAICTVTHVTKIFKKPTNYKQITKQIHEIPRKNKLFELLLQISTKLILIKKKKRACTLPQLPPLCDSSFKFWYIQGQHKL